MGSSASTLTSKVALTEHQKFEDFCKWLGAAGGKNEVCWLTKVWEQQGKDIARVVSFKDKMAKCTLVPIRSRGIGRVLSGPNE